MSIYACKLIFNDGQFYSLIDSVIDQFVCPVFSSFDNFAKFTTKHLSNGCDEESTFKTFQVTKDEIHSGTLSLAKLKRGEELSMEEAVKLYEFNKFVSLVVADHQYSYEELEEGAVNQIVDEIGLRSKYPEDWDWQDILDSANSSSFFNKYFNARNGNLIDVTNYATPEDNGKLSGRYISRLVNISGIVGPNKISPQEAIEKFRPKDDVQKTIQLLFKLKKYKVYERTGILLGIYKQISLSHKKRTTNGEFRNFIEKNEEDGLEFVVVFIKLLSEAGLKNHARRLQQQYL